MTEPEFYLRDMPFYGTAKTITGDLWWYEEDGKRYPLLPAVPRAVPQERDEHG